jgi:hypothetical protein
MIRALLAFGAVATALLVGSPPAPARAAAPTALRVTVWPRGTARKHTSWTLRCRPPGGSLPQRARACRRLLRLKAPFRPVPHGVACTDIYGGPEVALVTGRFEGRRVRATFRRTNGCEIARWNRVRFLFPVR